MTTTLLSWLHLLTALGCGIVGGVFFAFSTFVLQALARLPAPQGIAAMQSINRVVINPLFLGIFVGTAGLSLLLATLAWWQSMPLSWLAAGVLYFFGTFVVTMMGNVPLNNQLERLDPASAEAAEFWPRYVQRWGHWNHLRTFAAVLACALLVLTPRN